jgi:hypothetical protein
MPGTTYEVITETMNNTSTLALAAQFAVVLVAALVAIISFAFLIPLDSVPAVSGVTIILCITYGISLLAWLIVLWFYARDEKQLIWLNTHLMFLVILPATIGATAMNVTTVQNTRNLLAGKLTS